MTKMMKAAIFVEPGRIELADKPLPDVGPNDALMRITTTTICGTDVHILKGEYPVAKGLTVGHEPVGVIEKLGSAVRGYREGQRVIAGAICPDFNSYAAQDGAASQDGSYLVPQGLCGCHGYKATAGWRFGNLIDGTQADPVAAWRTVRGELAAYGEGKGRIVVRGTRIEHWVNGVQVLQYDLDSDAVRAGIARSKFRDVPGFGTTFPHHLLLQDHGGDIAFRNLKLRPLGR